jgi:hypothetical protein
MACDGYSQHEVATVVTATSVAEYGKVELYSRIVESVLANTPSPHDVQLTTPLLPAATQLARKLFAGHLLVAPSLVK